MTSSNKGIKVYRRKAFEVPARKKGASIPSDFCLGIAKAIAYDVAVPPTLPLSAPDRVST
jgi:hypothetical protein